MLTQAILTVICNRFNNLSSNLKTAVLDMTKIAIDPKTSVEDHAASTDTIVSAMFSDFDISSVIAERLIDMSKEDQNDLITVLQAVKNDPSERDDAISTIAEIIENPKMKLEVMK